MLGKLYLNCMKTKSFHVKLKCTLNPRTFFVSRLASKGKCLVMARLHAITNSRVKLY